MTNYFKRRLNTLNSIDPEQPGTVLDYGSVHKGNAYGGKQLAARQSAMVD
jgi:hypothetical protein